MYVMYFFVDLLKMETDALEPFTSLFFLLDIQELCESLHTDSAAFGRSHCILVKLCTTAMFPK